MLHLSRRPLARRIAAPVLLAALALPAALPAQTTAPAPRATPAPAPRTPAEAAIRSHVAFLASDAMQGREAGSHEFDIAAQYVAAQFGAAGLTPAGDTAAEGTRSFLQHVPLVTYVLDGEATASIGDTALVPGADFIPAANPAAASTRVSAPVVFVGYGIVAPAYGRDDYAGVDVRGKIVAILPGSPKDLTPEERAYFGSPATKATIAAAHGAAAVVQLTASEARSGRRDTATPAPVAPAKPGATPVTPTPPRMPAPRPRTTWWTGTAGFSEAPTTPFLAVLTRTGSAKLFAGADAMWRTIVAEAAKPAPAYRSTALPATMTLASKTSFTQLPSENVVGILPGSDPVIGREVVVLSAHLDHIGVSPADPARPDADRINNGALDDAIGIASLIEEAKRLAGDAKRPRRTIMFLAVTAEEKGLVGSSWFSNHPTVPANNIVADVNLDMPILFYPFQDVVAFGGDRSTLGPIITKAAGEIGVKVAPDPIPEQGIFVRSDHFNFVKKGVPSIFLWPGPANGGKEATEKFLAGCYHHPCDDLSQPILWDQAVRFVDVNYRIARAIADADTRPAWNPGDYFGTTYANGGKGPGSAAR